MDQLPPIMGRVSGCGTAPVRQSLQPSRPIYPISSICQTPFNTLAQQPTSEYLPAPELSHAEHKPRGRACLIPSDPRVQHLLDSGYRQAFINLDFSAIPPLVRERVPWDIRFENVSENIRSLLADPTISLIDTHKKVVEEFASATCPHLVANPQEAGPSIAPVTFTIFQDFNLCSIIFSILHQTESFLTYHSTNPEASLSWTLLLHYAATMTNAEYILGWYHVFRTDGKDKFDTPIYLNRMSKLLWARLALLPTLFSRRGWVKVDPSMGPVKEAEIGAGAAWDLCMAVRLDAIKALAEYSVLSLGRHTPTMLVELMQKQQPLSESQHHWIFRGTGPPQKSG